MDLPAIPALIIAAIAVALGIRAYRKSAIKRRQQVIDSYLFPDRLNKKLVNTYSHLTDAQCRLVIRALRDYFHVNNIAGKRMVAMPSQVVDVAWHEFILFTRDYQQFCQKALGRFLHHTPAEAMRSPRVAQDGIKRAWKICCHRENIQPASPQSLPLLFAIDGLLNIPDGFVYSPNCTGRGNDYCAGHIGCSSGCSGGCGGGGGSSDGGDGGSGCGGGGD